MKWLGLLLLTSVLSATDHISPPSFFVDPQGNPWAIILVPDLFEFDGYTDFDVHTVFILTGQNLDTEQRIVTHELMHVVLGDHSVQPTTYHQFIYETAPGLHTIFVENPDLTHYLSVSN